MGLSMGLSMGLAIGLTACAAGAAPAADSRPTIVVTYSVLGAVIRDAVGDQADVKVLIPNGADPHEWEPSAKDIASLNHADLIVRNGLDLESGLMHALNGAADSGVPTFVATDHITVRTVGQGEGLPTGDADQAVGAKDPHLWMDPLTVRDAIAALAPMLTGLGIDASAGLARVAAELEALDQQVRDILAVVPSADRQLVTGHESLGYFAARYDFTLIGAIVPSLTSQAEVSSGDLARLSHEIEASGARAIFTEIGTSAKVARALGDETGVEVVDLASHNLPNDGSYATFITENAMKIAEALT
jgi:zinc/manganese transport system substrate-binding protein